MRDYRKFCRPKVQKNPKIGDVRVKLNCGEIVVVSSDDFKKVSKFFKIYSFVGSSDNKNVPGNIIANNTQFNVLDEFSSNSYNLLGDNFEIVEIVGAKETPSKGDIIAYNNIVNTLAVFDYNTFTLLSSEWDATGLYEINTYNFDDEVTEERYVIKAEDTTFIIQSSDYSYLDNTIWEVIDTISVPNLHDYVEIGGIKWATMNIGAESITDTGLYFQWGDTQGYTAEQVGSGEGQKYFDEDDCIYYNDDSYTKYNEGDSKITLELTDDAVNAAWGDNWRMPTASEFIALGEAVDTEWTADYQGSGVAGLICTDKIDSSKTLFFPACGYAEYGSVGNVGSYGYYWSSSLNDDSGNDSAYLLNFRNTYVYWSYCTSRYNGYLVRGILDE